MLHPSPCSPAVYGTDYSGKVCGSAGTAGYYITYPRINEDFIANVGVTDPTKLKFYGICRASCPKALDVVCNSDADISPQPTLYNQPATTIAIRDLTNEKLLACLSYNDNVAAGVSSCKEIKANCWITPQVTTPIMYRCVGQAHSPSPLLPALLNLTHPHPTPRSRLAIILQVHPPVHSVCKLHLSVLLPAGHCRPQ